LNKRCRRYRHVAAGIKSGCNMYLDDRGINSYRVFIGTNDKAIALIDITLKPYPLNTVKSG